VGIIHLTKTKLTHVLKNLIVGSLPFQTINLSSNFFLAVYTTLGEVVGLTFEQVKFVTRDSLPFSVAAYVHLFKLPAFITLGLPFTLLSAALFTYSNLSAKNEILALRSLGVHSFRIVSPVILISLVIAGMMFIFQEVIVPPANYKAAMLLEKEWNVERAQLAKYNNRNLIYQQYQTEKSQSNLQFLFFADRFDGQQMQEVYLLKYHHQNLQEIIVSQQAEWNEDQQVWQLLKGCQYLINSQDLYEQVKCFDKLPLQFTKKILDYANFYRDHREMNLLELYQQLGIIKPTGQIKKIKKLKISIQERYALPLSCCMFAFLGSSIGITTDVRRKSNSLGIALIIVSAYYLLQFLLKYLSAWSMIPIVLSVWMPNLVGLIFGGYYLIRKT
jgi:lipopolysaccharide export system permease protein